MAAQICETCKNQGKRCYCPPSSTCGGYEPRKMTHFEKIKLMDVDELTEWLDKNVQYDGSPWSEWFEGTYCNNCEAINCKYTDAESKLGFKPFYNRDIECNYCELERKCRFFPDTDEIPDNLEVIKLWLESEVEE